MVVFGWCLLLIVVYLMLLAFVLIVPVWLLVLRVAVVLLLGDVLRYFVYCVMLWMLFWVFGCGLVLFAICR